MNNNLEKLKYSGVKREAKILNASKISTTSSNFPVYDLDLSFENLSHREIKEKNFRIIDSKPYEKRFEAGKSLSIMLDESIKFPPYFSFESSTNKVNTKSIVIRSLFLVLFIAVVVYFYFYAYTSENQGMGWRFLSIKHPLLLSPTILIATWIGLRLLMQTLNVHTGQKAALFKFKGIKIKAKVLDTKITSYINEQPRVAFDLQFYDEKKHVHQCTLKKVVSLLKLNTASQEEIEIIYIPDNPKIVAFADDLD
nr:hypothetical protein [uncultured Flavobacterium sp.]